MQLLSVYQTGNGYCKHAPSKQPAVSASGAPPRNRTWWTRTHPRPRQAPRPSTRQASLPADSVRPPPPLLTYPRSATRLPCDPQPWNPCPHIRVAAGGKQHTRGACRQGRMPVELADAPSAGRCRWSGRLWCVHERQRCERRPAPKCSGGSGPLRIERRALRGGSGGGRGEACGCWGGMCLGERFAWDTRTKSCVPGLFFSPVCVRARACVRGMERRGHGAGNDSDS